MIARSLVIVGFVAASVQPAVGQGSNADARRRAAEQSAARYRFVDQADAAWDREVARERGGDCLGAQTTYDTVTCLGKEIETTQRNLDAYIEAFRGVFALSLPEEWRVSSASPTADEFLKDFNDAEDKWTAYKRAICSSAFGLAQGTAAPIDQAYCQLKLMRSHMRELGGTLGEGFHR
jgi:type II secretory pathway pseudopilin PulG